MEYAVEYCGYCYRTYHPRTVTRCDCPMAGDTLHSGYMMTNNEPICVNVRYQHIMRFDTQMCVLCGKKPASSTFDEFMKGIFWQIEMEAQEGVCSPFAMRMFSARCVKALSDRRRASVRELGFLPRVVANIVADYLVWL